MLPFANFISKKTNNSKIGTRIDSLKIKITENNSIKLEFSKKSIFFVSAIRKFNKKSKLYYFPLNIHALRIRTLPQKNEIIY